MSETRMKKEIRPIIVPTVSDVLGHDGWKENIDRTTMKTGTLASPPAGMVAGEWWLDTTGAGGTNHPLLRVSLVTT